MKITKGLHSKLEELFKALDFKVRYERGSFKSGYCLIEQQRVIVINKFFPMEAKVNTLVEILRSFEELDTSALTSDQRKLVTKLRQTELEF